MRTLYACISKFFPLLLNTIRCEYVLIVFTKTLIKPEIHDVEICNAHIVRVCPCCCVFLFFFIPPKSAMTDRINIEVSDLGICSS